MRFLADAGVAGRVVNWLRERGHDAVHLREQSLGRLPDSEVFAKASAEKRVLLTFDLDSLATADQAQRCPRPC